MFIFLVSYRPVQLSNVLRPLAGDCTAASVENCPMRAYKSAILVGKVQTFLPTLRIDM